MITIRLLGGLGNQMFQYAYGLSLKAKGYDVAYDRSHLVPGTHREYSLDGFDMPVDLAPVTWQPIIYEAGLRYSELYANPPETCTLVGYWQSEQYFKNAIPQVLQAFKFKSLSPYALGLLEEIKQACGEPTFLHVRRKDYVDLQHFHGMPNLAYYKSALADRHPRSVYIFSDDIPWCQENFRDEGFNFVEGTTKFEDLRLMKACMHAIIANSSFSWWGAWLGDCQQPRTVIAPKQWFNPAAGIDDTDIVPERWRKM